MPYTIQKDEQHLALVLSGGVTARDVSDLAKCLTSSFATGAAMKANVTNKNPVNPLNLVIIFVLLELVLSRS